MQPFLSCWPRRRAEHDRPKSNGGDATDFMWQAGVGMFIKAWESSDGYAHLSLRPELKARWDDAGADGHLTRLSRLAGLPVLVRRAAAETG